MKHVLRKHVPGVLRRAGHEAAVVVAAADVAAGFPTKITANLLVNHANHAGSINQNVCSARHCARAISI
jgi:hypothetical protein